MLYLYFSSPSCEFFTSSTEVCQQPWHWRSRSSEGLLGGSNSWEFRGNFSTRIAQHIPKDWPSEYGGDEYSLILLSWKDWSLKIIFLRCSNHDEHWDHLFRLPTLPARCMVSWALWSKVWWLKWRGLRFLEPLSCLAGTAQIYGCWTKK